MLENKVISVKWTNPDSSIAPPEIVCPICGQVWEKEGKAEVTPCKHLRLRIVDNFDPEWFGEWNYDKLKQKIDDIDLDVNPNIDIMDVLKNIKSEDMDTIAELETRGFACGPVHTIVLYGIKS